MGGDPRAGSSPAFGTKESLELVVVKDIRNWESLIPGEECWEGYILLHKALLGDGSGVTIWRTKAFGYFTVELWVDKDIDGHPIWGNRLERFSVKRDWDKAEEEYKRLVAVRGGFK